MKYSILFSKQAQKDIINLSPKLRNKARDIIRNRIATDPYSGKALVGKLKGYYSMRLSYQDRIVYTVNDNEITVYILRAKTHYGE